MNNTELGLNIKEEEEEGRASIQVWRGGLFSYFSCVDPRVSGWRWEKGVWFASSLAGRFVPAISAVLQDRSKSEQTTTIQKPRGWCRWKTHYTYSPRNIPADHVTPKQRPRAHATATQRSRNSHAAAYGGHPRSGRGGLPEVRQQPPASAATRGMDFSRLTPQTRVGPAQPPVSLFGPVYDIS